MSIAGLDLNLLVVLDAVLAEGSVARAGKRLHLTPSAISNALARLRTALGDPLLVRRGRGIVPTPRAAALAPAIARALGDVDRALFGGAFDPATTTRTFTLAVADAYQIVRLPRLVARFATAMPAARLRVVGIDALASLGGLAGTEIDVAIGPEPPGQGVRAVPLFAEAAALCARKGHPAAGRRLGRDALGELRHVAVEMAPGKAFVDLSGRAWESAGIPRNVALTVPSFVAAAFVAGATDLVASLPSSMVDALARQLALVRLEGAVPRFKVALSMAWHERTHADPGAIAFRELVRRAVGSAVAVPTAPRR